MKEWRAIFGKPTDDKRLRDVELILRFFALFYSAPEYSKPMKDFLSVFMDKHKNATSEFLSECEALFKSTTRAVHRNLGPRPFHVRAGLNVAAFDGVYVAFARNTRKMPSDIRQRYRILTGNKSFLDLVSSATTDEEVVRKRLSLVQKRLFK